mmetsp:Transcript_34748/g.63189  ORF Transcript_34748/g.63189 Transcript_34748/m.63189 type:complete len:207 (-) Transcript_34748:379-999(-)
MAVATSAARQQAAVSQQAVARQPQAAARRPARAVASLSVTAVGVASSESLPLMAMTGVAVVKVPAWPLRLLKEAQVAAKFSTVAAAPAGHAQTTPNLPSRHQSCCVGVALPVPESLACWIPCDPVRKLCCSERRALLAAYPFWVCPLWSWASAAARSSGPCPCSRTMPEAATQCLLQQLKVEGSCCMSLFRLGFLQRWRLHPKKSC